MTLNLLIYISESLLQRTCPVRPLIWIFSIIFAVFFVVFFLDLFFFSAALVAMFPALATGSCISSLAIPPSVSSRISAGMLVTSSPMPARPQKMSQKTIFKHVASAPSFKQ